MNQDSGDSESFWDGVLQLSMLLTCYAIWKWATEGRAHSSENGILTLIFASPLLLTLAVFLVACFLDYWEHAAPKRAAARERRRQRKAECRCEKARLREQRQLTRAASAARREAETFYRSYKRLIAELCPPALFRSNLNSAIPQDCTPERAWSGARDLIAGLQPIVEEGQRRQKEAEAKRLANAKRLKDIERQIRNREREIAQLSATNVAPDVNEEEISALRREIQRLRDEKETLDESHSTGEES